MRATAFLMLAVLIGVAGCGKPSETTISGTVKFQGKPLGNGYVLFVFDSGDQVNADIAIDGSGNYSVKTPLTGHAKIAVGSMKPADPSKVQSRGAPVDPSKMADPAKWVQIPEKYQDPDKSGKDATIKGGSNKLDIDLE